MTDETRFVQRLGDALRAQTDDARPTADCPEPEEIWRAARGELSAKRSRALLRHATTCGACLEAWCLAREIARDELPWRARLGRRWLLGGLVAAAALAVFLVGPRLTRQPTAPIYREDSAAPVRSLIPADRSLPRDACLLRWTPGPAGATYRLEVATARGGVLESLRGLTDAEHLVPAEQLEQVPSGDQLLWRVTTMYPDGREVSSVTFLNELE